VSAPSAARPPAPTTTAPIPRPSRTGQLTDRGVVRRDSVLALGWTVDGTVKVTGDVDVGTVRVSGTVAIAGTVTADAITVRGSLEAGGAVTVTGPISTEDRCVVTGPLRAQTASFTGTARIARDVEVAGVLTVRGKFAASSIRAQELRADGDLEVPGTVDAGVVDVRIRRSSQLGTVRARSVRLLRSAGNPLELVFGAPPPSHIVRIEADRVELEGVDVDFVRSPEVALGRDAHITELEGTVVRRHPTARVGPRSKTPPPYGLRR
jgi:cytoskeletal protein CcmA (bactofilin family)